MPIPPPPPKVLVRKGGTDQGDRRAINLHEGAGVTITTADDGANNEVDVTIASAVAVKKNGSTTGTRPGINFTEGAGITITTADDGGNGEVDVTIATSLPTGVGVHAYHNAVQSLTTATWTALSLNSERFDTSAFHDTGTNPSRLTVPTGTGGKYTLVGQATFAANATGQRGLRIRKGGSTVLAEVRGDAAASGATSLTISCQVDLAATDYVELLGYQDSGAGLDVEYNADSSPNFSALLVVASSSAPVSASYVVEAADGTLTNESVLGTTVVTKAAYGSRQAAAVSGRLFLPTDGVGLYRDTGSAWEGWGPVWPIKALAVADFSWVNQGGATATDSAGTVVIDAPAATTNFRILQKAAPGTPYTITVLIDYSAMRMVDFNQAGICFRESSSGKIASFGYVHNAALQLMVQHYTNATTLSTTAFLANWHHGARWFRISDDGTNRKYLVSPNGHTWVEIYSESRTTFLTADQVGIYVSTNNATYGLAAGFLSWTAA